MTRLAQLRANIEALRRKRRSVRSATAYCAVATALLWALGGAFLVDFRVEGGVPFRVALLFGVAASVAWAWQRWTRPWLAARETDLDVALMIEDQYRAARQPLGRDLVAALQFESPEAASWGSVALEAVVVEDVAERADAIDLLSGVRTDVLARRAMLLLATAIVAAAAVAFFPGHAAAFVNRMFLGRMHYPTATQIEKIVINGHEAPPAIGREATAVACPQGQPLSIEVYGRGTLPERGRIELAIRGERKLTVDLPAVVKAEDLADPDGTAYVGRIERLHDAATYQVYLGDAWTDPARIELVAVPVVDCRLVITPPEYVRAALAQERNAPSPGARNLEVLEGSRVVVEVASHNKPLATAMIAIGEKRYALAPASGDRKLWRLDPANTPLAALAVELDYSVLAVDDDGLSPERPPRGSLRIRADRPPRISAQVQTRHVLPSGRPVIEYRVDDDYGVARVEAKATILRETLDGLQRIARPPLAVAVGEPTLASGQRRSFAAPLASLALEKGDRLELVFEATDYRGASPGKSAAADALVFNVTDVAGIESAVTEIDPVLEQQIQSLIQDQLGIGESK